MKLCGWWLLIAAAFGMTAIKKSDASLVYYPEIDFHNILSPMNLCEQLCGQCGCVGTFVADDMCQCSCEARGCIPEYANCTLEMLRVCDESMTDCELIGEPAFGIRTRDPRKHCMECHESHDSHECGGHDGYDDYGANGYGDNGYGDGHGNYGGYDNGKKYFCCKKKKHKHKKHKCCKKHKHGRKIHIKIKGKLPDCCYFNNYNNHHEYDDYRTPERKRVLEEVTTVPPPIDNLYDGPPVEPIHEPEIETTTQARAYIPEPEPEPEPHYVDEEPKKCCNSNSNIHCDNCHIYSDCKEGSKYVPPNEYRSGENAPREEEPLPPRNQNREPVKVPSFRNDNPADNQGQPWPNENREPTRGPHFRNENPGSNHGQSWSNNNREQAQAPRFRYDNQGDNYGQPTYPGMQGCDYNNCEVLEFSHHKVKVPSAHFKPIIEKFLDTQSTDSQPIDLNAYNRAVSWHLFEDKKAKRYRTDSFQSPRKIDRDPYEFPMQDPSAAIYSPGPPKCSNVHYIPVVAPPVSYIAPVPSYAPSHRAGPDNGPVVFPIVEEEDSPPPAPKSLPHYLQTQKGGDGDPMCVPAVRPIKPVCGEC